jgi:hypothetical protein
MQEEYDEVMRAELAQTLKLSPQPHAPLLFGFLKTNSDATSVST